MTTEQQILSELRSVKMRLSTLEKAHVDPMTEYLSSKEITRIYGVSEATVRSYYKKGLITDIKMNRGGRGRKYSKAQCDKNFGVKLKSA